MSAPERHDGLPRLTLELTEHQAAAVWQDMYLGGCIRRALEMRLFDGATDEDANRALHLLLRAIIVEQDRGGIFSASNGNS